MRQSLTDLTIAKLPFTGKQYTVWDNNLPSFGVRVYRGKTFVLKQQNRWYTLGRYPIIPLKQARGEAKRRLATKYFPDTSLSTSHAIKAFLEEKKETHRPNTQYVFELYLKRLPDKHLNELTAQILYTYLPTTKSAANLSFSVFKAFLSWCVERGHLATNPLQGKKQPHKTKSRDRLLTDEEINLIWQESHNHNSFGAIIRVLILTGQRLNQITSLQQIWISPLPLQSSYLPHQTSPEHRVKKITFPPYIMKGNTEHTIPLTHYAQQHLLALPFPKISVSAAMKKFRAQLAISHFTLHDFRRYFSSTMAKLGVPIDITEALLSHRTGSRSQIQRTYDVYSRLEPMRIALAKYEAHLSTFCDGLNITEPQ